MFLDGPAAISLTSPGTFPGSQGPWPRHAFPSASIWQAESASTPARSRFWKRSDRPGRSRLPDGRSGCRTAERGSWSKRSIIPCGNPQSRLKRAAATGVGLRSRPSESGWSISTVRSNCTHDRRPAASFVGSESSSAGKGLRPESFLPRARWRRWLGAGVAAVASVVALLTAAMAREVIDSAGRKVEVPDRVERIMAAGPPASVLVYMLAPEKMIGWNLTPRETELPFLAPKVRNLPEIGRLTGRGNTANLEAVMSAKPDVIVDFGSVNATYVSLADRTQGQIGIPYLLIDGRFDNTAAALRTLG